MVAEETEALRRSADPSPRYTRDADAYGYRNDKDDDKVDTTETGVEGVELMVIRFTCSWGGKTVAGFGVTITCNRKDIVKI